MPGQPESGSNPLITMDCTSLTLNAPGFPPGLIVGTNLAFQVSTEFVIEGLATPFIVALMNIAPGDDFQVEYFAESLGPGPEISLGVKTMPAAAGVFNAAIPSYTYSAPATSLFVPAGTLPAGTYKLTCVVRPISIVGAWWTGFYENPVIQIHNP